MKASDSEEFISAVEKESSTLYKNKVFEFIPINKVPEEKKLIRMI